MTAKRESPRRAVHWRQASMPDRVSTAGHSAWPRKAVPERCYAYWSTELLRLMNAGTLYKKDELVGRNIRHSFDQAQRPSHFQINRSRAAEPEVYARIIGREVR